MSQRPTNVRPVPAEAWAALSEGRPALAETFAREALAQAPGDPAWTTLLALALSEQRRAEEALPLYRALTDMDAGTAAHWSNLGNCLCELGREHEALAPLQRARALGADDAAVHFGLARALSVTGPARDALAHVEDALHRSPGDAEFQLLRARLLVAIDEWSAASAQIDALLRIPLDAAQQVEIGYLLLRSGLYPDAERMFRAVLARMPDDADARIGLVSTLERVNRVDEARAERAHASLDDAPSASDALSDKRMQVDARLAARRGDHATAAQLLETLLAGRIAEPALRISLGFELGIARDRCGRTDEAMDAFKSAHAARRRQVDDDHPALARSDSLYLALDDDSVGIRWPDPAAIDDGRRDPVFVVGFPRSGTTLLEQLLDAHSQLASFDEQPFVRRLVQSLYRSSGSFAEALSRLDAATIRALRTQYFADVDRVLPALGTRRPVDKNPLNLVRLPLLPPFFRYARAILALRHPCDVVLSCYMQHFQAPSFAVTFETLDSAADMYDRVFTHWWHARDRLELPVHVLRYEDLVHDTETQARALFEFLQLPWEPALLDFTTHAQRRGAISTPSYSQVVQPVNARAVGRWHAYRDHFSETAMARLQPWIERFGYAG